MKINFHKTVTLATFSICILYAAPANAYLDPGTGSLIIQGLIAGIAAAVMMLRMYWYRVKMFFRSIFGSQQPEDSQQSLDAQERAAKGDEPKVGHAED